LAVRVATAGSSSSSSCVYFFIKRRIRRFNRESRLLYCCCYYLRPAKPKGDRIWPSGVGFSLRQSNSNRVSCRFKFQLTKLLAAFICREDKRERERVTVQ
jgi:hypothetical protein